MSSQLPNLIGSSDALEAALNHVEQASILFASPNPSERSQGEQVFLALRDLPDSLEAATFFLARSFDPFVNFQSLGVILHLLPSLPLANPSNQVQSLHQLKDFLLQVALTRGRLALSQSQPTASISSNSGPFPQYLRARIYQTFAAVQKRCLGLELSRIAPGEEATVKSFIAGQMNDLAEKSLGIMKSNSGETDQTLYHENVNTGLAVIRSLLDESSLPTDHTARLNEKVKAGQVATTAVGLTQIQHRWFKVLVQKYLLPQWLGSTLSLLNESLNRLSAPNQVQSDQAKMFEIKTFDGLAATIERLLSWRFILNSPDFGLFRGANQSETPEVYQLSEVDEGDTADGSNTSSFAKSLLQSYSNRMVPQSISSFLLSRDLILLLSNAYRYTSSVGAHSASPTLNRVRQCLLQCTSFQIHGCESSGQIDSQVLIQRNEAVLYVIETLIDEQSREKAGLLANRGNDLLFLIQSLQVLWNNNSLVTNSVFLSLASPGRADSFLNSVSRLSSNAFEFAFGRPRNTDEEDDLQILSEELIDSILNLWQSLSSMARESILNQQSQGLIGEHSVPRSLSELSSRCIQQHVVPRYIEGRLSNASSTILAESDDVSEIGSEVVSDQETFKEQLVCFSSLARISVSESLGFLLETAKPLVDQMIRISQGNWEAFPGGVGSDRNKRLEILWEQLHWITLISGHVLADDPDGESPEIPFEVSKLGTQNGNPAVNLINELGITLLQHLLKSHVNSPQTSPQVIQTLLWFNARWIPTYLLLPLDPSNNSFASTFSAQNGSALLSFILQSLIDTLSQWLADPDVVSQVSNLLFAFTRSNSVLQVLLSRPEMEALVKTTIDGLDSLPSGTHGEMCASLVKCIYGSARASAVQTKGPDHFFGLITSAIESRLGAIIHAEHFDRNSQRSDVILSLQSTLDLLEGLASSAIPGFSAIPVYDFVSKFFEALIGLVKIYISRIEVIISIVKVFKTLIRSLDLRFGCEIYILKGLNSAVYNLLHETSTSGLGDSLVPTNGLKAMEDDTPFEALSLFIEILNDLMQGRAEEAGELEEEKRNWLDPFLKPDLTSDVCLYGFSVMSPLLTSFPSNSEGPLAIPNIRELFGSLSSGLISTLSGRLIGLALGAASQTDNQGGRQVFGNAIKALSLSLEADEISICFSALESIRPLCEASTEVSEGARSAQISAEIVQQALDHLLVTLLRSILMESLSSALLGPHLDAIRVLVLSRRSDYLGGQESLVRALHQFCLTTSLTSQRITISPGSSKSAPTQLSEAVESERRQLLSKAVEQLVGAIFEAPFVPIPNFRTDRMGAIRAREQENKIERSFRERGSAIVGKVRGILRVR